MTDKPAWSQAYLTARAAIGQAQRDMQAAENARCLREDSGGVRCTADAEPEHDHRYR